MLHFVTIPFLFFFFRIINYNENEQVIRMKDLNVLLVNDSFPPVIDGVSNAVVNYANIISDRFGTPTVATPFVPEAEDDFPYEVLRYPSLNTTRSMGYRTGIPFDAGYISTLCEKPIDIIHAHCPITSLMLARIVRQQTHKPVVLTYHTKFDIDIARSINSKLLQEVAINALVSNIEGADEVWAVSHGAGENLKSLGYTGDYIVMPNGVDFTKDRVSAARKAAIREKYHIPSDRPVYLFVGRLMWYKGIRIIINALTLLRESGTDFAMVFVGKGLEEKEIREYIDQCGLSDKCIFTGAISDREELKAVFSTCDLFLFPSTFDTNGIVVREAASAALGSVLIRGSCAAEDTSDGVNAIHIEENASSLAAVLIKAGTDMNYFHQIGENARDQLYISWNESVEKACARYEEIIEKFDYENSPGRAISPSENFFSLWSELANAVSESRKARQIYLLNYEQRQARIRKTLDELISEQKAFLDKQNANGQQRLDNIEEYESQILQYLDDVSDRYL